MITFKKFLSKDDASKKVRAVARNLLGTDALDEHSALSHELLTGAKLRGHKYVDTPDGPWVLKRYQNGSEHFVQVDPPRVGDHEHQKTYFTIKSGVNEAEEVIESLGELYETARMHNVIGHIFKSEQFHYHKPTLTFTSEVSETPQIHKRLWSDAEDVGFGIRSARTGDIVLFTHEQTHKDRENEVTHWTYKVYNPKNDPKLRGLKVVVYND